MTQPRLDEWADRARAWCDSVAVLGVDALVDAKLIAREELGRASVIVAEELFIRLCLNDHPPPPGPLLNPPHAE